ncbi:hypothetical protein FB567DRAFT_536328 [Paraphoma chrysanthemicola]|uniref:Uncharacterized protein n=1 Tax=Paraphoma chrysanthemicola TaxID=798071 RepID=A0A8K0QX10_9PLEO|nr:hypothetical protein FB567DRAFT_536328 [Paraphoma chrysanthemicola]
MLFNTILATTLLPLATALPQASPTPSPSSLPTIPWSTKLAEFRAHILTQPTLLGAPGFGYGPGIQLTFADTSCLQVRLYNWDCNFAIPYKPAGIVSWLDSVAPGPITDPFRYYVYGRYVDPDDGWDFYGEARLAFGACGNRGPQSSCGVGWCVDAEGKSSGQGEVVVPEGQSPYVDPNSRDNLCPWLRGNATVESGV